MEGRKGWRDRSKEGRERVSGGEEWMEGRE